MTCNLGLQRHVSSHKSRHPASCPHSQLLLRYLIQRTRRIVKYFTVYFLHPSQTRHFRSLRNNSRGPIAWCMCCNGALRIDSVWKEARVIVERSQAAWSMRKRLLSGLAAADVESILDHSDASCFRGCIFSSLTYTKHDAQSARMSWPAKRCVHKVYLVQCKCSSKDGCFFTHSKTHHRSSALIHTVFLDASSGLHIGLLRSTQTNTQRDTWWAIIYEVPLGILG